MRRHEFKLGHMKLGLTLVLILCVDLLLVILLSCRGRSYSKEKYRKKNPEAEFNEFELRIKYAKNRF